MTILQSENDVSKVHNGVDFEDNIDGGETLDSTEVATYQNSKEASLNVAILYGEDCLTSAFASITSLLFHSTMFSVVRIESDVGDVSNVVQSMNALLSKNKENGGWVNMEVCKGNTNYILHT